ncbi:MAG: hypothetical protein RBT61_05620 [Candidatus Kapabacteria bacterium]|nr:hypothetical protein [Candidatus Kapabacteria bacterium]
MISPIRLMLVLIIIPTLMYGRNDAMNWFFGDKSAISFNTSDGEPIAIEGSLLSTLEGCSAVSDTNGNLLFYTDGVRVWNRNHEVMNPNNNLAGHYSSTQSALIIRQPMSYERFYIFTTDAGEYVENIDPANYENRGLNYSIVDMSRNNGLGEIVAYNIFLQKPSAEKLSAVFHENKSDVWIFSQSWETGVIYAYLLTDKGIERKVENSGKIIPYFDKERYIGQLKAAPSGDKIAGVVQGLNFIMLYKFDNATGKIYDYIRIPTGHRKDNYGLEFSPSGNILYVSDHVTNTVYSYNVAGHDSAAIKSTEVLIIKDTNSKSFGALQLAPNGKIYLALNGSKYLGVINNPDEYGGDCYYSDTTVYVGDVAEKKVRLGLPNFNQGLFNFSVKIDYQDVCENQPLLLRAIMDSEFEDTDYQWSGPNGFESNEKYVQFDNSSEYLNGRYYVKSQYKGYKSIDSIDIIIRPAPLVEILGNTTICVNTSEILSASFIDDSMTYLWSTGDSSSYTEIFSPGVYHLQSIYPNGCSVFDTLIVQGIITNSGYKDDKSGLFDDLIIDKNHRLSIEFVNNDDEVLKINSVYIKNSSEELSLNLMPNWSQQVLPFSETVFSIDIFSKKPKYIDDTLIVEVISPYCTLNYELPVRGKIIVPIINTIPDITEAPGSNIAISISSSINTDTDTAFSKQLTLNLKMPSNYFLPENCINCEIIENTVSMNARYIKLKSEPTEVSSVPIQTMSLTGMVLTGSTEAGMIEITDSDWSDSLFVNENHHGSLTIESCSLPLRQIKLFKPTNISISPNPIIDLIASINVYSEEKGEFGIYLANSLGQVSLLQSFERIESSPAEYNMKIDMSGYGTGSYMLILRAPWSIKIIPVVLIN